MVLGGFVALKLLILAEYGPFSAEDTNGYRFVADAMSRDPSFWSSVPDWKSSALSGFVFRPIGYPVLLASFHNDGALVLCQIIASAIVAVLLCRLVLDTTDSVLLSALAGAFYLGGYTLLLDNSLLSDSLYVVLFNVVVLTLLRDAYRQRPITVCRALLLGLAWGYSIWTRESGAFLTLVPLMLLLGWPVPGGVFSWAWFRPAAAFLTPVLMMVGLYVGWNVYRTDEVFLGITGAANYLRPVFDIATSGTVDPFDDSSVLSTTVKRTMKNFEFPEQFALFQTLQDETQLSPVGLQSLFLGKFIETVRHHPVAYARVVAKNLDPANFGSLLFNPIFTLNDFFQLEVPPHRRVIPGIGIKSWRSLLGQRDWTDIGLAAASVIGVIGSTGFFLAMLVRLPLHAARQGLTRQLGLGLKSLGVFALVAFAFALVHTEARLIVPAIPSALIAAAITAAYRPPRIAGRQAAPVAAQEGD